MGQESTGENAHSKKKVSYHEENVSGDKPGGGVQCVSMHADPIGRELGRRR